MQTKLKDSVLQVTVRKVIFQRNTVLKENFFFLSGSLKIFCASKVVINFSIEINNKVFTQHFSFHK
jgi:5'(3')-deoxyribonucleotidase